MIKRISMVLVLILFSPLTLMASMEMASGEMTTEKKVPQEMTTEKKIPQEMAPRKRSSRKRPSRKRPSRKRPSSKKSSEEMVPGNSQTDMVFVPSGDFIMGIKGADIQLIVDKLGGMEKYHFNATPQHRARTAGFYIDKYEATNAQYKQFCDTVKRTPLPEHWEDGNIPSGKENHAATYVTWHDAVAYCQWKGKRLPTEQEWEHAARGNDDRLFPWGFSVKRKFPKYANLEVGRRSKQDTVKVGKYSSGASSYKVMDMCGNVSEWTASNFLPYPNTAHEDEFFGNDRYVVRGGSWYTCPYESTVTFRYKYTPVSSYEDIGFRCVSSQ